MEEPPSSEPALKTISTTVYFHGQPGTADELALFGGEEPRGWIVPDRSIGLDTSTIAAHLDALADEVRSRCGNRAVKLIGFSLGAYVALEVAARLPDLDLAIDLVSPAAPLATGDYLDHMAGKAVFTLARNRPALFAAMTAGQGLLARLSPGTLGKLLFASAQGGDASLYGDPTFRAAMQQILADAIGRDSRAYRAEVIGYVGDWAAVLEKLTNPVTIWQGQSDNWSPPAMAEALAERLSNVDKVHRLDGCSHYTTLREYLRFSRAT